MKASKLVLTTTLIGTLVGLTGCSSGFQASQSPTGSNSSSSVSGGGGSSTTDAQTAFKALSIDGTVSGYDGVQIVEIDKTNMQLVIRLPSPIPSVTFTTTSVAIQQIPGATLSVESLSTGGSALVLRIPLSAVVKGVTLSSPSKLPNGQDLPGIPDGELPSAAVTLSNTGSLNPTIYLGPSVVGIYVNSPYSIPIGLTLPIKNAAHTRTWGYVSSITASGTDKGGFFVSLALPDDIARIIDDVL